MATKETLDKLSDNKLIDAVKNYKQYGYSEELRELAISILNERGISSEQLKLTGNFENHNFDYANQLLEAYNKNSKIALISYIILFTSGVIGPIIITNSVSFILILSALFWVSLITFIIFLIKSFINQNEFSKLAKNDFATEGALMYLFLGMPFYLIMYFHFRKDMRAKMDLIK